MKAIVLVNEYWVDLEKMKQDLNGNQVLVCGLINPAPEFPPIQIFPLG